VRFDASTGSVRSVRVALPDEVSTAPSPSFAVSSTGTLAFLPTGVFEVGTDRGSIALVDRKGATFPIAGANQVQAEGTWNALGFAPGGHRFAASLRVPSGGDAHLWLYEIDRGTRTRLTNEGPVNTAPQWTRDGSRLAFSSAREPQGIYVQSADQSAPAQLLLPRGPGPQVPSSWSADGQVLIFSETDPRTGRDIWMVSLTGQREAILATPADELSARLSPDGRWLAYESDSSGQPEVYVRSFHEPGSTTIVSTEGGTAPRWAGSGELVYRHGKQVVSVPVTNGEALTLGPPTVLFEIDDYESQYDVSSDGQRFVMLLRPANTSDGTAGHVKVVVNWLDDLKRLVPVN
jgi:serine/threonine-protein kinase